jgi:hypothetical protein
LLCWGRGWDEKQKRQERSASRLRRLTREEGYFDNIWMTKGFFKGWKLSIFFYKRFTLRPSSKKSLSWRGYVVDYSASSSSS